MTWKEYQKQSAKTAIYPGYPKDITYPALGFVDEVGELMEKLDKVVVLVDSPFFANIGEAEEVSKESGDVIWYAARLCDTIGKPLGSLIPEAKTLAKKETYGTCVKMLIEASKVAGIAKKVLRDSHGKATDEQKMKIRKSVVNVLAKIIFLSDFLPYSVEQLAEKNLEKLLSRQKRGKLQGSGDNR